MTPRDRAIQLIETIDQSGWGCLPLDAIPVIEQAIEDQDKDWSHALKEAVEAQFSEWSDFHEWPNSPDVEYICDWLKRLVESDRANRECCKAEGKACAEIARLAKERELRRPENDGLESPSSLTAGEIEAAIRARSEKGD